MGPTLSGKKEVSGVRTGSFTICNLYHKPCCSLNFLPFNSDNQENAGLLRAYSGRGTELSKFKPYPLMRKGQSCSYILQRTIKSDRTPSDLPIRTDGSVWSLRPGTRPAARGSRLPTRRVLGGPRSPPTRRETPEAKRAPYTPQSPPATLTSLLRFRVPG